MALKQNSVTHECERDTQRSGDPDEDYEVAMCVTNCDTLGMKRALFIYLFRYENDQFSVKGLYPHKIRRLVTYRYLYFSIKKNGNIRIKHYKLYNLCFRLKAKQFVTEKNVVTLVHFCCKVTHNTTE